MEIFTNSMKEVGCSVVLSLHLEVLHQLQRFIHQVVVLQGWVILYWLVSAVGIEAELRRRRVVEVVNMSEYFVGFASTQLRRFPYHLHRLRVKPHHFVLIVNPGKEESLKAHLTEESSSRGMMSEGIDMPGHTRHIVESFFEPSQAHSHLIDKVLIVHIRLVRHAPASIDELQLSISHNSLHLLLLLVSCRVPPPIKKGNLHNRKLVLRMFVQLTHYRIDSILHACKLSAHISSIEVVVDSLEPANIIMRVRNQMHGQIRSTGQVGFFVVLFHHLLVVEPDPAKGKVSQKGQQEEKRSNLDHNHLKNKQTSRKCKE